MNTDSINSKVWSFCHPLRDDGLDYGEPADLVEEVIENIEAGLANFRAVAGALPRRWAGRSVAAPGTPGLVRYSLRPAQGGTSILLV